MNRLSTTVVVSASAYVGEQILADVASRRIVEVGGITMDGGTLIYPFTFTRRDLVAAAVVAIIWGNILVKVLVTGISIPWIYAVKPGQPEAANAD